MNHFLVGTHPLNFNVPYICKEPYDYDRAWIDYPVHKGINLSHLRFYAFRYYDRERMGSFFQNWLFFGLLKEILGMEVSTADFIREDENEQKFISTVKLPKYLQKWQEKMVDLSSEEKLEIYHRSNLIMEEAVHYTRWLARYPDVNLDQCPEPLMSRETALSLVLLGDTLTKACRATLNPAEDSIPLIWGSGGLLMERMEAQGWCPFLVAGLEKSLSLEAKYFAAQIGPPKLKRNHRKCSDDLCTTIALKMQHLKEGCICPAVAPDITSVVDIIHQGVTPLLRFYPSDPSSGKESFLKILHPESKTPYVALSHVWKDGLGNEESNSLSQCQLARIQKMVDSLFATNTAMSYPFWMDTLLVPQGDENKSAKDKSLNNMSKIYQNADKVLVIDSEIVASCSTASSGADVLLRVSLSNWVRRLWTLQEGVFANSIHFLVSDGTVSFASLFQGKLPSLLGNDYKTIFGRCLGIPYYVVNDGKDNLRPTEGTVINMIRSIQTRTSTFNKDEALCIALLLGVDPREIIAKRKTMNPMPTLLSSLNLSIPPCMILLNGERNEEVGFRWAPKSFLVNESSMGQSLLSHPFEVPIEDSEIKIRPSGELDPHGRGLKVMFPGIRLGKQLNNDPLDPGQFLIDTSGGATEVIAEGKPPLSWLVLYSRDKADKLWKELLPRQNTSERMAIIICSYGPNWRKTKEGVLVQLTEEEDKGKLQENGDGDDTIFVRRICRVLVTGTPEYDDFSWIKAPEKRITGTWRPVTQMWCID